MGSILDTEFAYNNKVIMIILIMTFKVDGYNWKILPLF